MTVCVACLLKNIFYYVTVMNENYVHPALPDGAEAGILEGMYRLIQRAQKPKICPACSTLGERNYSA